MNTFATDIDLLHWEPNIMSDAAVVAQTMLGGSGDLDGTTFTIDLGSLSDARVSSEHAILLSGAVAGTFPILSVDSATTLTLSVLYDDLFPDTGEPAEALAPKAAEGLNFVIRTFWPQRRIASEQLLQAAGIPTARASEIVNPQVLRRPCTLGTLQMIYTGMAANSEQPEAWLTRAQLYERLYRKSLRSALLEIDTNDDGIADAQRPLGVVALRRG